MTGRGTMDNESMGGSVYNSANVLAIILAGGRDFGRCPYKSHLPPPLWPMQGKPVIGRLLTNLADQGVKRAVICAGADTEIYQAAIEQYQPNRGFIY